MVTFNLKLEDSMKISQHGEKNVICTNVYKWLEIKNKLNDDLD